MIMTPRLRKFALAVHITLAVGWIGAVAGYIALDVAAATSKDTQKLRAAYLAMELKLGNYVADTSKTSLLLQISRTGGAVQEGEEHPVRSVQHGLFAQVLFREGFTAENYLVLLEQGLYHKTAPAEV